MAKNPDSGPPSESLLVKAAQTLGTAAGKGDYTAVYMGSGTFSIRKPKRDSAKLRQTRLKSRRRGARK